MQLCKDIQNAILRKIQQSESNFDRASLEAIYGKDAIDRHLEDLIDVHLVRGRVMKSVSPPGMEMVVLGLTPAGHTYERLFSQ
jgi:hypothetical protein